MSEWLNVSTFGLTLLVMLVGLFGLIVPIFPGIIVIWLAGLGYGVVTGFNLFGIIMMVLLTIAMLAGVTVDNVLMGAGARRGGASWLAVTSAMVAGIAGTILFPPLGGLIASPLAVLLVEFLRGRDLSRAWRATRGLATGWGLSFLARFGIGVLMIGLWLVWALAR